MVVVGRRRCGTQSAHGDGDVWLTVNAHSHTASPRLTAGTQLAQSQHSHSTVTASTFAAQSAHSHSASPRLTAGTRQDHTWPTRSDETGAKRIWPPQQWFLGEECMRD